MLHFREGCGAASNKRQGEGCYLRNLVATVINLNLLQRNLIFYICPNLLWKVCQVYVSRCKFFQFSDGDALRFEREKKSVVDA